MQLAYAFHAHVTYRDCMIGKGDGGYSLGRSLSETLFMQ
jgi:hypothetical protein